MYIVHTSHYFSWQINNLCNTNLQHCQSAKNIDLDKLDVRNYWLWCFSLMVLYSMQVFFWTEEKTSFLHDYWECQRAELQDFTEWRNHSSFSAVHNSKKLMCADFSRPTLSTYPPLIFQLSRAEMLSLSEATVYITTTVNRQNHLLGYLFRGHLLSIALFLQKSKMDWVLQFFFYNWLI